ncbi:MAG: hypothetical protein P1P69_05280 [Methanosarcinaceae archaeon]|nr:hypothetical protein [Methanosarcinaceae archaeon]
MKLTRILRSEDAVSEVVDFSIILGIMLLAVAVIGVTGFPLVEHMQESGHAENVRQSFIVLTANINKIVFGATPSQSVELKLYGGLVSVTGDSAINVTVQAWNGLNSTIESYTFERQMRMIQNEYEDRYICYEDTGTWAQYPLGDAVMVSRPRFVLHDDVLTIPAVMISGSTGISGVGLVRVTSDGGVASVYSYYNVSQVDITIKSKYYKAWERYLNDTDDLGMNFVSFDHTNTTVHLQKIYSPDNIDVHVIYSPMSVTVD